MIIKSYLIKLTIFILSFIGIENSLIAQAWSKSFTAGFVDSNSSFLGGSEVLQVVSHKKKLYASVGYWQDGNNIWYGGTSSSKGWSQIIRLDNSNGKWLEDHFLGSSYLRPELLKQVVFTKDALGNPLTSPDTVLIAAGYSPNYITSTVKVKTFTRNDATGSWAESQIVQGNFPAGENYSIRDVEVYTDSVTGLERIYATVGTKGVFAGKYNPASASKIDWISTAEFGPVSIRPLGITLANNALYFSSGNKLYLRTDGGTPSYSVAHDFSDLSTTINSAVGGIRGLTTINNPNDTNQALLLMWCPNGQSKGVIYRLEPNSLGGFTRIYEAKISVLVQSYLPGSSVSYLLGAYNEFYEYIDPVTNDTSHLIGFEAQITGGGHQTWNGYYKGALFAKRNSNIQYSIEEINGPIGNSDPALVSNRCYVQSPFAGENAIYFGGFDPNGNQATNKAWVFKKDNSFTSINEVEDQNIKLLVYPNPAVKILTIEIETNDCLDYKIISVLGKTIRSGKVCTKKQIDVSELSPNMYFLKIGNQTKKFIIQP